MKYIRTKESVYELMLPNTEHRTSFDHNTIEPAYFTTQRDWVAKKDVIKASDNIEDLCDAYFAISNTDYKTPIKIDFEKKIIYQWQSDKLVVTYTFEQFIPYHTIYGTIWTDKCLYVAKLTDKGWELV